jgi:AcrR family transcriptional regulator
MALKRTRDIFEAMVVDEIRATQRNAERVTVDRNDAARQAVLEVMTRIQNDLPRNVHRFLDRYPILLAASAGDVSQAYLRDQLDQVVSDLKGA